VENVILNQIIIYLILKTRLVLKYRHCEGKLVFKVTDDKVVRLIFLLIFLCIILKEKFNKYKIIKIIYYFSVLNTQLIKNMI